jgi:predicted DNA-binding transcriptional regulator YafY
VPIWGVEGRNGGYGINRGRTPAPLTLTAEEALAVAVALQTTAASTPFATAAARAARKVLAGLPSDVREAEHRLVGRLHRLGDEKDPSPYGDDLLAAVAARHILRLTYADAAGVPTEREVEALSLLKGRAGWYLVG